MAKLPPNLAHRILPEGVATDASFEAVSKLGFNVFIAFPKDAEPLAQAVYEACLELGNDSALRRNVQLSPRKWNDGNCYLSCDEGAQVQIEDQQGAPGLCQVVIGITRFRVGTQTREEIHKAMASQPRRPCLFVLCPDEDVRARPGGASAKARRAEMAAEWEELDEFVEALERGEPITAGADASLVTDEVTGEADPPVSRFVHRYRAQDGADGVGVAEARMVRELVTQQLRAYVEQWLDACKPRSPGAADAGEVPADAAARPSTRLTDWPEHEPPYFPGLGPFRFDKAIWFGGRVREAERLARMLLDQRQPVQVLHVKGASGVGKSSLVEAGVLPRLQERDDGGAPIEHLVLRPGNDPFVALIDAAMRSDRIPDYEKEGWKTGPMAAALAAADPVGPDGFCGLVDRLLPLGDATARRVLVVDQLEELLLHSAREPRELRRRRETFAECLRDYVSQDPRNLLITAIRADRDHLLAESRWRVLGEILSSGAEQWIYPPGLDRGLEEMVGIPAARAGFEVEDAFLEALRADLHQWQGQGWPPILGAILREMAETWKRQPPDARRRVLSRELFEAVGRRDGVIETLTSHAERTLDGDQLRLLPHVFSLLVRLDDHGEPTKRRITRQSLEPDDPLCAVVDQLIQRRLVNDEGGIELSHDILFRAWPALAAWLEDRKDDLDELSDLEHRARRWERRDRQSGELLPDGDKLANAERLIEEHPPRVRELPVLAAYVEASRLLRDQEAMVAALQAGDMQSILRHLQRETRLEADQVSQLRVPAAYYAMRPDDIPRPSEQQNSGDLSEQFSQQDPLDYFTAKNIAGSLSMGTKVQHVAAMAGQIHVLERLADLGADLDAETERGMTPFQYAAFGGSLETLRWFLDRQPDPERRRAMLDHRRAGDLTALRDACWAGDADMVRFLLDQGCVQVPDNEGGFGPLHVAIWHGRDAVVALLLSHPDTDPHQTLRDGRTPLHIAAQRGRLDAVRRLLDAPARQDVAGADVDARDKRNWSPLHYASQAGFPEVARRLLECAGVLADAPAKDGARPLHLAAKNGHAAIVESLLARREVDPSALMGEDEQAGFSALYFAAYAGCADVVELLLADERVEADRPCGPLRWTPLHAAAKHGYAAIVERLLARADIDPNTWAGKDEASRYDALYFAADEGHAEVVRALLADERVEADRLCGPLGWTALHAAANDGHVMTVERLLTSGKLDPNDQRSKGRLTPLHMAARGNKVRTVRVLLADPRTRRDLPDANGDTPFDMAVSSGSERALVLLRDEQIQLPWWLTWSDAEKGVVVRRLGDDDLEREARARLARPEAIDWPLPPLVDGDWERLDAQTVAPLLPQLLDALPRTFGMGFLGFDGARRAPLRCYARGELYELHMLDPTGAFAGYLTLLCTEHSTVVLNGTSPPIHAHNAELPPTLETFAQAAEYLRFFCAAVHGNHGAFTIFDSENHLLLDGPVSQETLDGLRGAVDQIREREIDEGDSRDHAGWHLEAVVKYSNALFRAYFHVQPTGMITMMDDDPILNDQPFRLEVFRRGLRCTRAHSDSPEDAAS